VLPHAVQKGRNPKLISGRSEVVYSVHPLPETAVSEICSFRKHATPRPTVPKQCPYPGARPASPALAAGLLHFCCDSTGARNGMEVIDMQTSHAKPIKRPLLTVVRSGVIMITPLARGRANRQSAPNQIAKSPMT
jgi:hypothetical protein